MGFESQGSVLKRLVFLFWGLMDTIYLIHFAGVSFGDGRTPIVTDIASSNGLNQPAIWVGVWLSMSIALTVSVGASALLFLSRNAWASKVAYAQEPLRLLLATPSLAFLPWLLPEAGAGGPALSFALFIGSEALKIRSLRWVDHTESNASNVIGTHPEELRLPPDPEGLTPIASRVRYGQRQRKR